MKKVKVKLYNHDTEKHSEMDLDRFIRLFNTERMSDTIYSIVSIKLITSLDRKGLLRSAFLSTS